MSKKSTSISVPKIAIAAVLVLSAGAFFFFTSQNKTQKTAPETTVTQAPQEIPAGTYTLEFSGKGEAPYIVVASKTEDVRSQLPIKIDFLKNGISVWTGTIDGDPTVICRDQTGCGVNGPNFVNLNITKTDTIEFIAKNKDGIVLAGDDGSAPSK